MEHLRELRNRLLIATVAVVVGIIVGWIVFDPVWAFIKEPFCETPQAQQLRVGECTLTYGGIFQSFFLTLKVSAMVGIVVSSPVWLYQVWAFVTPALYRNEKRYSIAFLGLAIPLFLLGAALAYFIMDTSLAILLGFAPSDAVAIIQIDEYVSYVLIMLVIFGISFELPLLLVFLNIIGILPHATVKKHRRTVIFAMFVFGAVITPGGDPLTMMALATPMILLYFLAEFFMFMREKRAPAAEDFSHLSDDEASPLSEPPPEPLTEDSAPIDSGPIDSGPIDSGPIDSEPLDDESGPKRPPEDSGSGR
ncbi:twin-arginine translocase subunit TatC [Nonomuraea sp. M3C6]|uniref:Sec-independent protein translocase protein TatC n=1 Tax=Nonomuraea marmarensis TaxID=3351344 RepID=A0ABW7A7W1_9ACTN